MSRSKSSFKNKVSGDQKGQSQRQLRVAELLASTLVSCLRKGKGLDLRLYDVPLTITKVNVSADLRIANCYFVPFNTKLSKEEILDSLDKSKYAIRHYVTEEINLRYSPELRFFYDCVFEDVEKVDKLFDKIKGE